MTDPNTTTPATLRADALELLREIAARKRYDPNAKVPWANNSGSITINLKSELLARVDALLDAAPAAPVADPTFTDAGRAALAWVLWHHQGASSFVGQPIRYALGMGQHEELSDAQIEEAKSIARLCKFPGKQHSAAQAVAADGEPLVRNLSPLERVEEDIVVMTRMSNDTKRLPMEETESLARLLYYIEDLRRAAVSPATADTSWKAPKQHCQNGGDVCLAGNRDGVCCPEDSCDIDDGTRKNPATAERIPDECAASGSSCSYAPEGRHGEMQCRYCGKAKPATADERAAFESETHQRLKQLVGDEAASMVTFGDGYDSDYVSAAWIGWQAAIASQAAAPQANAADERAALQKDARRYQQCRESAVARGLFETPEEYDAMVDASLRKEGREVLTGRGHNFGKKVAKDGTMYRPERASQAAAPASPDWRHIANEWADVATNGIQAVKNVRDGVDTAEEAIARLVADIERCRSLPPQAAAPADGDVEQLAEARKLLAHASEFAMMQLDEDWHERAAALLALPAPAVSASAPPAHCQCQACCRGTTHASDCAVHNEPAYPNGPCDCGAIPPALGADMWVPKSLALPPAPGWYLVMLAPDNDWELMSDTPIQVEFGAYKHMPQAFTHFYDGRPDEDITEAVTYWTRLPAPPRPAAPAAVEFSYALSQHAEKWSGSFDSIEGALAEALSGLDDAGKRDRVIWVGQNQPINIDYDSLAEEVIERIQEQAFDQVGEVADVIGPYEETETKLLSLAIKRWIDEHGQISCYRIDHSIAYGPGAPEYESAIALLRERDGSAT